MSESMTLTAFLQERRARIAPETAGLPARRARSRPGLRREDVAELLGVSLYWYALFEAGTSGRRFSAAFLDRLAVVLRLNDADRETLLRLASATGAVSREAQTEWNHRRLLDCVEALADTVRRLTRAHDAEHAAEVAQILGRQLAYALTIP